ncbi:MAG: response regulator transcription factor [Christensenellales bacterium]
MQHILLTEDDPLLRESIRELLEREGYRVTAVSSCRETQKAMENLPDLLVLDVLLPDGNGFSLCRRLREEGHRLPVLFLTAYDEEEQVVHGLDVGGDDYVTKPFRTRELLSRIKARLREASPVYMRGDLRVDLDARSVTRGNSPVYLTPTEFSLLMLLLRNRGRIMTRQMLLSRLWDQGGAFIDDNTLSVHVSRLRKKIGPDNIETIRDVGYRWKEEVS